MNISQCGDYAEAVEKAILTEGDFTELKEFEAEQEKAKNKSMPPR